MCISKLNGNGRMSNVVQEFELLTVTYGLSSAPFLVIRVLHVLVAVAKPRFPATKGVLTHHTYVDDILVGSDTEEELCQKREHIVGLLQSAGCALKKGSNVGYRSRMFSAAVRAGWVDATVRCSCAAVRLSSVNRVP